MYGKNIKLAPEIPDGVEGLVHYIKEKIDCPLPIRGKYEFIRNELTWFWIQTVDKYRVDDEDLYVFYDDDLRDEEMSEKLKIELRPVAINLTTWIDKAKEDYLDKMGVLETKIADKEDYPKHFLSLSKDKIKKRSKNGISLLYPNINVDVQQRMLKYLFKNFIYEIVNSENLRSVIKWGSPVGAVNGEETNYLFLELNRSSKLAHAYPCTEKEAFEKKIILKRDSAKELDYDEYFDGPSEEKEMDLFLEFS